MINFVDPLGSEGMKMEGGLKKRRRIERDIGHISQNQFHMRDSWWIRGHCSVHCLDRPGIHMPV